MCKFEDRIKVDPDELRKKHLDMIDKFAAEGRKELDEIAKEKRRDKENER